MHRTQENRQLQVCSLGIIVATLVTATMLSGSCFLDTEIRLCGQDLHCPPGWVCSADQETCVKSGSCGNGRISDAEVCDDGNNDSGDGCSSDCASKEVCGNDIIDVAIGEQCDDGNMTAGDGCSADCTSETCGNRIVDLNFDEQCDTGPGDSLGCDSDCTFRICGDGYINLAAEDCDKLGDASDRLDCDGDCTLPECGDGHTNPNFKPSQKEALFETCDSGINSQTCNGNDGQNTTGKGYCQLPACGDGYHNPAYIPPGTEGAEQCDLGRDDQACNGNNGNNTTGKGYCQLPACGDGYHNPLFNPKVADPTQINAKPEECDTGGDSATCNGKGNADGKGNCQIPSCGDGYFNSEAETCDGSDKAYPRGGCASGTICSSTCKCG